MKTDCSSFEEGFSKHQLWQPDTSRLCYTALAIVTGCFACGMRNIKVPGTFTAFNSPFVLELQHSLFTEIFFGCYDGLQSRFMDAFSPGFATIKDS